jgi:hypothetical protein
MLFAAIFEVGLGPLFILVASCLGLDGSRLVPVVAGIPFKEE